MNEIHQMPELEGYLEKINEKLDRLEVQMEHAASTPPPLKEPPLPNHSISPAMTTYLQNRAGNNQIHAGKGVSPLMQHYLKSKKQNP
jgi:hypothetical protein